MQQQRYASPTDVTQQAEDVLARNPERWERAWAIRMQHHPAEIRFDYPSSTLPVTLTGSACALNCAHCGGVYLRHMHSIQHVDPDMDGMKSFLISGGCDARGRVPVLPHLPAVARLRESHRLNWHLGFIDEPTLQAVAPLADVISFDVVGHRDTAREVYGLDVGLDDYMQTFDLLQRHAPVVPHITVGLRAGRLSGERAAINALAERQVGRLIFIVLIPTTGTKYADCAPPDIAKVADLLLWSRERLPQTRIYLGCMRPHGAYRRAVDEVAIRAGLNAVVNPTHGAEQIAQALGLGIIRGDECCALN